MPGPDGDGGPLLLAHMARMGFSSFCVVCARESVDQARQSAPAGRQACAHDARFWAGRCMPGMAQREHSGIASVVLYIHHLHCLAKCYVHRNRQSLNNVAGVLSRLCNRSVN